MQEVDLTIVGAGPAGLSTAMHLLRLDPSWGERMVLLEKSAHPRSKLCAGGITQFGLRQLRSLDLSLDVPHVPVREARLEYRRRRISVHGDPIFAVTRRSEFDAWLAGRARERGVPLLERHAVERLERTASGIRVSTGRGTFHTRALVGADGATGIVRRWLGARERPPHVARLLEVVSPAQGDEPEYREHMARFDFSSLEQQLQGYYWDFPSLRQGQPFFNSGLYDAQIAAREHRAHLPNLLEHQLKAFGRRAGSAPVRGHPIHWFSPRNRLSAPRVILVGDAAGAEPLFGEGIGPALGYGQVASRAAQHAFRRADFSFREYPRRLLWSPVGRYLTFRWTIAAFTYRLASWKPFIPALWSVGRWLAWLLTGRVASRRQRLSTPRS